MKRSQVLSLSANRDANETLTAPIHIHIIENYE